MYLNDLALTHPKKMCFTVQYAYKLLLFHPFRHNSRVRCFVPPRPGAQSWTNVSTADKVTMALESWSVSWCVDDVSCDRNGDPEWWSKYVKVARFCCRKSWPHMICILPWSLLVNSSLSRGSQLKKRRPIGQIREQLLEKRSTALGNPHDLQVPLS